MDRGKERSKYQGGGSFESFWGSRGLSEALTCGVTGGTGAVEAVPHVLPGLLVGCWWWWGCECLADIQVKTASEQMKT